MKTIHDFTLGRVRRRLAVCVVVAIVSACAVGFSFGKKKDGFVAHEWGTFTSLQTGDGKLLAWNGVAPTELPKFVYNWQNPGPGRTAPLNVLLTKGSMASLQRMETPVVYFYGEKEQTIDLTVRFPKGKITEWYPQAKEIEPSRKVPLKGEALEDIHPSFLNSSVGTNASESLIRWDVTMIPGLYEGALPTEQTGNHYFAARETDAVPVRVAPLTATNSPEFEKFLFYRGVGNFASPLMVTTSASGEMTLINNGTEPLRHLFVLGIKDGTGKSIYIKELAPSAKQVVNLETEQTSLSLPKFVSNVSGRVAASLKSEGLYEKEAKAMVKTWVDSWFQEEGTRVLYVLPRSWTDEILPMTAKPHPRELVRVMVGRAEVISPAIESRLEQQLSLAKEGDSAAENEVRNEIKRLGRFAPPVFERVRAKVDPKYENPKLATFLYDTPVQN